MPHQSPSISSGIRDNRNRGTVGDFLRAELHASANLDIVTAYFTVFAYDKLRTQLDNLGRIRLLFGEAAFIKNLDPEHKNGATYVLRDDVSRVEDVKQAVLEFLLQVYRHQSPQFVYYKTLFERFRRYIDEGLEIDENLRRIRFPDTEIWQALYSVQRDGKRVAIECKFIVSRDFDKTIGIARLLREMLRCDRAIIVVPFIGSFADVITSGSEAVDICTPADAARAVSKVA